MQPMFEKHIKQKSLNIWKKAYASGIIGIKSVVVAAAAVASGSSGVVVVVEFLFDERFGEPWFRHVFDLDLSKCSTTNTICL